MRFVLVAAGLAFTVAAYFWSTGTDESQQQANIELSSDTAIVGIQLPNSLSEQAQRGKTVFNDNCAVCHGPDAVGQVDVAPPLIHKIYEPSHHGDESFQRAVAHGVPGHHWPFGNMPPIEELTRSEVELVITYVRELQRVNGIY